MFGTPVPGYLHPMGWQRPAGNLEFVVTRGCAQHLATGVGCALDIGNSRTGAPVLAMASGTVYERYIQNTPGQVGHGALIIRVRHANGWTSGYAHLQSFSVALGAVVVKGQQIGVLGATGYGISGPHLHTDVKLNGVARDLWPLLDQQSSTGDDMTSIVDATLFLGADGKPQYVKGDATKKGRDVVFAAGTYQGYRLDGTTKPYTLATPSTAHADARCYITQVPSHAPVGGPFLRMVDGVWAGTYIVEQRAGVTVAPDPPVGGGPTPDQLTAAYNAGVAAASVKAQEAKE